MICKFWLWLACLSICAASAPAQENLYVWSATGPLHTPRHSGCAVALADGRVLVSGGEGTDGALATAEVYGPEGKFSEAAPMGTKRSRQTCTRLDDGRVLVAGGRDGETAVSEGQVYDPAADTWTPTANAGLGRWGQTASLLPDGRVLLAGGETREGATDAIEIFDPGTNRFELLEARLSLPRTGHVAAVLQNGWVLIAGGAGGVLAIDFIPPDARSVEKGGFFLVPRAGATATTLIDGRVLIAGGRDGDRPLSSTLLYDPQADLWLDGPEMKVPRSGHAAVLIPNNGGVLLIGGVSGEKATGATDLFDPLENRIVEVGGLTAARLNLAAAAQGEDGTVLAVGGLAESGVVALCGTFLAPTIRPNKSLFIEGETVSLAGSHWRTNLSVQVSAIFTDGGAFDVRNAIADGAGSFVQTRGTSQQRGRRVSVTATQESGTSNALRATTLYTVAAGTSTTLSVTPPAPVPAGDDVTFRAELRPSATTRADGRSLGAIQGQVKFFSGTTLLGTVASGTPDFEFDVNQFAFVTLRTSSLPAGGHSLRAVYEGNSNYGPSEALKVSYRVDKRSPRVLLAASSVTPKVGETVTLTVTVSGDGPRPAGTVRFRDELRAIGDVPLAAAGPGRATATLSYTSDVVGTIRVSAAYPGDAVYSTGADQEDLKVTKAVPTLTLVGGSTTVALFDSGRYATNLDFTTGKIVPTGRVFLDVDNAPRASLDLSAAEAPSAGRRLIELTQAFNELGIGQHTVRFRYAGDSRFEAVTGVTRVTIVTKGQVTTSVQFPRPIAAGQPVTFAARVFSAGTVEPRPVPTGSVQMIIDGIVRQTLTLSSSASPATATTSTFVLARGRRNFAFVYSGDGNYDGRLQEFFIDVE